MSDQSSHTPKLPQSIWHNLLAFAPNRDTLGGTAYLIVENEGNILIDCPAEDESNRNFLHSVGGVRWLFLTHRGAIGRARELQNIFDCEILMQEQEAYLLPGARVTGFQRQLTFATTAQAIWTPGHSPGSACLYYPSHGGILFSGRHLLPNHQGKLMPLRTAKTFHWRRQLKSIKLLLERFTPETLHYVCPGANTGFLRGERAIANAYQQLASLDLSAMQQSKPLI